MTVSELREGMRVAEPVFGASRTGEQVMLMPENHVLNQKHIMMLYRAEVKTLRVYYDPAKTTPQAAPPLPKPEPTKTRAKMPRSPEPPVKSMLGDKVRKEAVKSIKEMFSALHEPGEVVKMTTAYTCLRGFENALGQVVASVTADPKGFIHIHDLKSYDEYTFHHSMSVAMLSVATGQQMGLDNRDLLNLCRAATLHDVGKQTVSQEILNKPGKLNPAEFETIQEHATAGALRLTAKGMGDSELWNAIMFHHEKVDGSGYPKQLVGNKIPLFSRIIAVADVYDAITSYRPYRKPMMPAAAYDILCAEVGRSFDYEIVKAFAARLDLYPLGSVLQLSTGETGVVIDNRVVQRPVVRLIESFKELDLAHIKNLSVTITDVLNPNELT
jgi:putative nucleotidyltransferase with HDIG domain